MNKQRKPVVLHVLSAVLLAACLALGQGLHCSPAVAEQNGSYVASDVIELMDESNADEAFAQIGAADEEPAITIINNGICQACS